ncbi:MAG: glycosyltransferase [Spirochaetaceae bacterium]|nr:glycosyltransferase [Spirochaetaceae bacterium]
MDHLKLTLISLEKQNLDKALFEVVVTDDGSTDSTADFLSSYETSLNLVTIRQENQGQAIARNAALKKSKGDVILFIDDDLICPPFFLDGHLEAHGNNQEKVIIGRVHKIQYADVSIVEADIRENLEKTIEKLSHYIQHDFYLDIIERVIEKQLWDVAWVCFTTGNSSLKRSILDKTGFFDENFYKWGPEDIELGYRIYKKKIPFLHIKELYNYHLDTIKDRDKMLLSTSRNLKYIKSKYSGNKDIENYVKFTSGGISLEEFDSRVKETSFQVQNKDELLFFSPFNYINIKSKTEDLKNKQKKSKTYPNQMAGFNITNQCNLKCEMCWQTDRKNITQLEKKTIEKTLGELKKHGSPPVYLWGGEPFLHPDFWGIVKMIKTKKMFSIVNTNGLLIKDNIDNIISSQLDMLIISIDGPEDVHDSIRGGKGLFQKVITGIEMLIAERRRKPIIVINSVVTEKNYLYMDKMVELKEKLGADYLEFQFLIFYTPEEKKCYKSQFSQLFNRIPDDVDFFPDTPGNIDMEMLIDNVESVRKKNNRTVRFFPYVLDSPEKIRLYFSNPKKLTQKKCENIHSSLWVEPNGDVVPCSIFPNYTTGNIAHNTFDEIWNNTKYTEFRSHLDRDLFSICYKCCDLHKTYMFQS